MHLVDIGRGERWRKADANRPVLYQSETATSTRLSPHILSAQTAPYAFAGTGAYRAMVLVRWMATA